MLACEHCLITVEAVRWEIKFVHGCKTYDGRQTAVIYLGSYTLKYEYASFYETPKPSIHTDVTIKCLTCSSDGMVPR